jgi:hypothetical protein
MTISISTPRGTAFFMFYTQTLGVCTLAVPAGACAAPPHTQRTIVGLRLQVRQTSRRLHVQWEPTALIVTPGALASAGLCVAHPTK